MWEVACPMGLREEEVSCAAVAFFMGYRLVESVWRCPSALVVAGSSMGGPSRQPVWALTGGGRCDLAAAICCSSQRYGLLLLTHLRLHGLPPSTWHGALAYLHVGWNCRYISLHLPGRCSCSGA